MKPAYRADIDGLRAIAVIAVIAFHAFPESVRGGFIGVDIFFVISGFLISNIILDELSRETFSFGHFYSRRIKRIFPSLIVVLSACLGLGWLLLLPDEWRQLGKHSMAGITFASNIALWREAGYFDTASNLKPLLHLWSLGVEEQFYILWPMCLALAFRKKIASRHFIFGIAAISFAANLIFIGNHPSATFYLPGTRLWELLMGALLVQQTRGQHGQDQSSNWRAYLGAALIIASIVLLDEKKPFPGWWALLPTIGTCLIIRAGRLAHINHRLLSRPTLVYIGLLSYPLYLWHWPLLVFLRICHDDNPAPIWQRWCAVFLSLALAWLCYNFLELSLRRRKLQRFNRVSHLVVAALLLLGVSGFVYTGIITANSAKLPLTRHLMASRDWKFPGDLKPFIAENERFYKIGDEAPQVLFLGDSNMQMYAPRISQLILTHPQQYKSAVFSAEGGCLPIPGVKTNNSMKCAAKLSATLKYLLDNRSITSVVIAAQWHGAFGEFSRHAFETPSESLSLANANGGGLALAALGDMIKSLRAKQIKVYLIAGIPTGPEFNPRSMIKRPHLNHDWQLDESAPSRSYVISKIPRLALDLKKVAKASGAIVIDPLDTLCSAKTCFVKSSDGSFIYKDASHLTASYVTNKITFFDSVLKKNLR